MTDATSEPASPLPQGVGKCGPGFWIAGIILLAVLSWGIYGFLQQILHGLIVTGMRTIGQGGAAWGLYIAFDVYFIGVSFAGIAVAALVRLLAIADLRPLTRIAELLTLVTLPLGALVVLADLGRPFHGLFSLPRVARPHSPFFGTFTLVVAGYFFSSLVFFFLAGRSDAGWMRDHARGSLKWFYRLWAAGYTGTRDESERHQRTSFWLSIFILPVLVTAHSTLGFIFGIQGGRPGWFSALQAPGFVVMAGVSGIGALIVVAGLIRKVLHLENQIRPEAIRWLGNMLWVLILVYLYFMVVEELTANYASSTLETHVAHEIVSGHYAGWFWTVVITLVVPMFILLVMGITGFQSIALSMFCGATVQVAALLKRLLIVVPSQTHGLLLPYPEGTYRISVTEISVTAALTAFGVLMFLVFVKIFPIIPLDRKTPASQAVEPVESHRRHALRLSIFAMTLLLGLALTVGGLVFSARYGTQPFLDPVVPFSPVIFIVGIMLSFSAAAIYEIVPGPMK